jgi:hypothetical protein
MLLRACTAFVSLVLLAGGIASADDSIGRALLIGVQSYGKFGQEWSDLDGPFHDVELIADLLEHRLRFDASRILVLRDPTREQLVLAFERLIDEVGPGEFVYVHYSGHGSRVRDANGDEEADGFDSTLVPIDARENAQGEILDDELALWLHELNQRRDGVEDSTGPDARRALVRLVATARAAAEPP